LIFENQAVEHQNELLNIKVSNIQKESPYYQDCDTEVQIGIGGLKFFWKPSSLMLLFQFLRQPKQKKDMHPLATSEVSSSSNKEISIQNPAKNIENYNNIHSNRTD